MVQLSKDTVDIYCFCKNLHEAAQEHLLCKLPPISLKQIEQFLHFSLWTVETSLIQNRDPLGKDNWAKT